jgi:hypothetical protein
METKWWGWRPRDWVVFIVITGSVICFLFPKPKKEIDHRVKASSAWSYSR